jgi:hypothetical protein
MTSIPVRTALCALVLALGLTAPAAADDAVARSVEDAGDPAPAAIGDEAAPAAPRPSQQDDAGDAGSSSADGARTLLLPTHRSHRHQFGFRVGAGADGRFAIRYKDGPSCGDGGEAFCRRIGTGLIDAELGFGVSDNVEVTLLGRFGLADDAAARALPLMIGLGVRAYSDAEAVAKLFFGGRAMLDLTSSDVPGYGAIDLGLRGEFGLMVDVIHHLGIFVQLGAAIHVLQALNFIGDVTAGVQARFP